MRASSLSNKKVIELLNAHFVPVYVDGTYLQANSDTKADELAAYREVFAELLELEAIEPTDALSKIDQIIEERGLAIVSDTVSPAKSCFPVRHS